MHKNNTRSLIAVALAAVMPLSVSLMACNNTPKPYVESGNTVTFDFNDGVSRNYSVLAEEGQSVVKPAVPNRVGYQFVNWYTDAQNGTVVTFPYTPTDSVTLFARWEEATYTVTFDLNYEGSPTPAEASAKYNKTIEEPQKPERDRYTFVRWQTLPNGGTPVTFPYTVKKNTTLYARWRDADIKVFDVAFDLNYEGAPAYKEPIAVPQDEPLTSNKVGTPSRPGYEFLGWTDVNGGETAVTFPYTPSNDVTLYAMWKQAEYNISFAYNYPGSPERFFKQGKVLGGEDISQPDGIPVREGYTFDGWFASDKGGAQITFPATALRNTTYYAHWTKTPITPQRNIFDVEFTYINPTEIFPGYSGSATGIGIVQKDDTGSAFTVEYPPAGDYATHYDHYITYLYKPDAKLTFEIYSDKDVSNVTLYASLAYEIYDGGSLTIAPTGDFGFSFIVNGEALNYRPITITGEDVSGGGMFKGTFAEYKVMENVSLKKGKNTIVLAVNNSNPVFGGVLTAAAPMVDYIRLDTDATLTWSPVYDNVYQ